MVAYNKLSLIATKRKANKDLKTNLNLEVLKGREALARTEAELRQMKIHQYLLKRR